MVALDGRPVDFVADPRRAPPDSHKVYARPDDLSDREWSWRRLLQEYNHDPGSNPLKLYPAFELYGNDVYRRLVDRFGLANTYILSAGWGLIRADFLTPYYDITFSPSADPYKRRRRTDRYEDFCMLPNETADDVVFFGGKDYLPLFSLLTGAIRAKRTVFYNSKIAPELRGVRLVRFGTTTRTNWHYECANSLLDRQIKI
jgi:hypothetical protein